MKLITGTMLLILLTLLVQPAGAGNSVTVSGQILSLPPVAAFSGTPLSGTAPLTVTFKDSSSNTPISWKWEYQRSGISTWTQFSTAQSPSYAFTATGTYSIRLTATNAAGSNTLTKASYISVIAAVRPPVAWFTQDIYLGRAPLTVHFTDRSLNSPTSWNWQFGDGATSTEKNPAHTYTSPGIYIIRERVTNAAGSDTGYSGVVVTRTWW